MYKQVLAGISISNSIIRYEEVLGGIRKKVLIANTR